MGVDVVGVSGGRAAAVGARKPHDVLRGRGGLQLREREAFGLTAVDLTWKVNLRGKWHLMESGCAAGVKVFGCEDSGSGGSDAGVRCEDAICRGC